MSTTIRQLHDKWASAILPKDSPQIQRQEMERAFYSGFFAALTWQVADVAAQPDDKAEQLLQSGFNECEDYFKTLRQAPWDITRT